MDRGSERSAAEVIGNVEIARNDLRGDRGGGTKPDYGEERRHANPVFPVHEHERSPGLEMWRDYG
jgi:hypothetical protein